MSAPTRPFNTTIQILGDATTLNSLVYDIYHSCGTYIDVNKTEPFAYGTDLDDPRPEQVIQYYRASSVALTLDGYNNTAVYVDGPAEDTSLPMGIDVEMISCMNSTIGGRVPLVVGFGSTGAATRIAPSVSNHIQQLCLLYLLYAVVRSMRVL